MNGKIVMPKHCASEDEVLATLGIYYEAGDWLPNDVVRAKLVKLIGAGQYHSSYTKKCQVLCYFGFVIWEDISDKKSQKKITESGRVLYNALISNDVSTVDRLLVESLETVDFGRNNCGAPSSDSLVQPPVLAVRLICDLVYMTYQEFAYALWGLVDGGLNYADIASHIKSARTVGFLRLPASARIYADAKPLMIMQRWGFFTKAGNKLFLSPYVERLYGARLKALAVIRES